jgi:hypothetical protein
MKPIAIAAISLQSAQAQCRASIRSRLSPLPWFRTDGGVTKLWLGAK